MTYQSRKQSWASGGKKGRAQGTETGEDKQRSNVELTSEGIINRRHLLFTYGLRVGLRVGLNVLRRSNQQRTIEIEP